MVATFYKANNIDFRTNLQFLVLQILVILRSENVVAPKADVAVLNNCCNIYKHSFANDESYADHNDHNVNLKGHIYKSAKAQVISLFKA